MGKVLLTLQHPQGGRVEPHGCNTGCRLQTLAPYGHGGTPHAGPKEGAQGSTRDIKGGVQGGGVAAAAAGTYVYVPSFRKDPTQASVFRKVV